MAFYSCGSGGGSAKEYATVIIRLIPALSRMVTLSNAETGYSGSQMASDEGIATFFVTSTGVYTATCEGVSNTIEVTDLGQTYVDILDLSITITFTVEGAVEDTIAISNDWQTIPVVFGTNSHNAQVTMSILVTGEDYTFTSKVAKAIDGTDGDYTKVVSLTKDTTTVKVMPEDSLYWYGNECTYVTLGWDTNCNVSGKTNLGWTKAKTYFGSSVSNFANYNIIGCKGNIDFSKYNKYCYFVKSASAQSGVNIIINLNARTTRTNQDPYENDSLVSVSYQGTIGVIKKDIPYDANPIRYPHLLLATLTNANVYGEVSAIWFE